MIVKDFFQYLDSHELSYVVLIIMLFILPRLLSRMGLPLGLGAFVLGFVSSNLLDIFTDRDVITTFATLGISSLFLYAGLEVDFNELKRNSKLLLLHLLVRSLTIGLFIYLFHSLLGYSNQISALISLALLTPSTGFILDTLPSTALSPEQKRWIKTKAIAVEILALLLLLLVQSNSPVKIAISVGTLLFLLILLPILFHWVSKKVALKTPGADFSFLLLLAVATGTLTKKLGAYYLVGAFLVGFTVNFYEKNILQNPKEEFEKTAKFFAAFFMPFYFFNAGLKLNSDLFSLESVFVGLALTLILLPVRLGLPIIQQKILTNEPIKNSLAISTSLLPTLVFGLVLIDILKSTGHVDNSMIGGLIIYTIIMTILPSILLRYFVGRKDLAAIAETYTSIKADQQIEPPQLK